MRLKILNKVIKKINVRKNFNFRFKFEKSYLQQNLLSNRYRKCAAITTITEPLQSFFLNKTH